MPIVIVCQLYWKNVWIEPINSRPFGDSSVGLSLGGGGWGMGVCYLKPAGKFNGLATGMGWLICVTHLFFFIAFVRL